MREEMPPEDGLRRVAEIKMFHGRESQEILIHKGNHWSATNVVNQDTMQIDAKARKLERKLKM